MTDTLRVGVIGVGYLGNFHAQKYAELASAQLVGVYDSDARRAQELAAKYGCRAFGECAELLAQVDAVSIAVPTPEHARVGAEAIAARVHLLMEKPLAATLAEGEALAEAAERAAVILQVGHLERFNPVLEEVRLVLSTPRFIECHRLSPFAGRGVDTDVVFDVMIHDLDLILSIVDRPLLAVEAVGVAVLGEKIDIANARFRFEGGCIANVTASRVSFKRERKLRVFQEDAYVSMDLEASSAVIASRGNELMGGELVLETPLGAIRAQTLEFGNADPLRAQIAAFVECVRCQAAPLVGAAEGLAALRAADRVIAAMETPGAAGILP